MSDTSTVTVRGPFAESLAFTLGGLLSFYVYPKDHKSKGAQVTIHSRGLIRSEYKASTGEYTNHIIMGQRKDSQMYACVIIFIKLSKGFHLTMREGDLERFGGVSEIPHCQAAVRVAAHELLPFVMPAN